MKNKILLFIVVILSIVLIVERSCNKKASFFDNEKQNISVLNKDTGDINKYDIEEYIVGVVAGEMPASFNDEALKAQAIASRTFAYYKINNSKDNYDVTKDKTSQVFLTSEEMKQKWQSNYDKYYSKIKNIVKETENLVITYEGKIISSYYFSMSNGKTENVKDVFGETKSYLVSVDSYEDDTINNYTYVKEMSIDEFKTKLNIIGDITINSYTKTDGNNVATIVINNEEYTGTYLRKLFDLRSTDFRINVSDKVYITTIGYGHDVGMSQYGANKMAEKGYSYEEILKHYYTNVEIENINSII